MPWYDKTELIRTNLDQQKERNISHATRPVHNFAISLDGFGTGEGQSADAHFGHAGERLHEWMFATRWWPAARR